MKYALVLMVITLFLTGCRSDPISTPAKAPLSTSASESTQNPAPLLEDTLSPTILATESDDYCKPPFAVLPVEDGNDISENEIVYELIRIWLRRYHQPNTPPACRIKEYTIEKVYDDPELYTPSLEPRGDFMRVIVFSVKPAQVPSDWMSFQVELGPDNSLRIAHIVAITKTVQGYTLEFAYP